MSLAAASLSGRHLGILLATADPRDAQAVLSLARAADRAGVRTSIFLMAGGLDHLPAPLLDDLLDANAEITACATGASARSLAPRPGVQSGSQYDLALLAAQADRLISFA